MSIQLVTGTLGSNHVTSAQEGAFRAGLIGSDHYLLKTKNWDTPPSMQDANTVIIPPRDIVMQGRHISIDSTETVTIQSGGQGQKRSDLIVARYELDPTTGLESVTLQAIKGTPTSDTPEDPSIETGSILDGAIVHDMPICRINLDGVTITGVDDLEQVLTPVWDSLTQSAQTRVFTMVVTGHGRKWETLWTATNFQRKFGVPLGDNVAISVCNGDPSESNGTSELSMTPRIIKGQRADVVFSAALKNNALFRINGTVSWQ